MPKFAHLKVRRARARKQAAIVKASSSLSRADESAFHDSQLTESGNSQLSEWDLLREVREVFPDYHGSLTAEHVFIAYALPAVKGVSITSMHTLTELLAPAFTPIMDLAFEDGTIRHQLNVIEKGIAIAQYPDNRSAFDMLGCIIANIEWWERHEKMLWEGIAA